MKISMKITSLIAVALLAMPNASFGYETTEWRIGNGWWGVTGENQISGERVDYIWKKPSYAKPEPDLDGQVL